MTLEELLSDQGTYPLTSKVNGASLRARINAEFKRVGVAAIDDSTPSDKILEAIYGLEDQLQTKLLTLKVTTVKGILNFKRLLAWSSLIATFGLIILFTITVRSEQPLTEGEIDLIKTIGGGAFDVIKALFAKETP